MENNIPRLATPISHLFKDEENARKIINASDCLECRDHGFEKDYDNQEVFHCELQPIHQLKEEQFDYLEKLKIKKPELKLISFHLASCFDAPVIKNGRFVPGGNKLSRSTLLANAQKNFTRIKEIFGPDIMIAVENNNHYKTEAYDYITLPDFISEVVNQNDIHFLFDIAHARISAVNQGVSFEDYVNRLPINRLVQIHISRPGYNDIGEIIDKHELPADEEIAEVLEILKNNHKVKYLTVEYYKDTDVLVELLKIVKQKING